MASFNKLPAFNKLSTFNKLPTLNKLPTMTPLPDEIWHAIFSHFYCTIPNGHWSLIREDFDRRALRFLLDLSRVCRQFYSVVQRQLYCIIISGIRRDEHQRQVHLARSLVAHPELGLNVRWLTIDDIMWPSDVHFSNQLEERIRSLNMPQTFQRLWNNAVPSTDISTTPRDRNNLTTFILALTPSVRLVDISYSFPSKALSWLLGGSLGKRRGLPYPDSGEFFDDEYEQAAPFGNVAESYANHLPNLVELHLRNPSYNSPMVASPPIADFRRALIHPNLRTLRVQGFHWLSLERETRVWASFPIRIQCLELADAIIDAATIRHVLTICKDLRSLYITLGNARKLGVGFNWEFDLTSIGNTLRERGRNLVEFGLQTDGFEVRGTCHGRIGSLQDMPGLKHLYITKDNFVGVHGGEDMLMLHESLPFSLETLCLYPEYRLSPEADYPDVFQETNDEICGVQVGSDFPDLREITIYRFCAEEKAKGGEFGCPVEGWKLVETETIVGSVEEPAEGSAEGSSIKRMVRLNSYLTRKPIHGARSV
ncbi:hypothetical protein N0V84_007825 [Fusarium piperis]|uniref:F-box domain-containing protein n=1 Tax=Fusarium piperis TaxID=1435070 RepID=A0A9W9BMW0_9HYPO|nr:hypothetical protein N0V84_007825 [Fusarium piperis]